MKKIVILLLAAIVVLTMVACGQNTENGHAQEAESAKQTEASEAPTHGAVEEVVEEEPDDTWSVFIYMCSAGLETEQGLAMETLEELFDVGYSENVNLYIQTDGAAEWGIEGAAADMMQRFHIVDGGMDLIEETELTSMADQDTLYEFLLWGEKNYPADKMGVVFWNYDGGPLLGATPDELPEGGSLTPSEMELAFSRAAKKTEVIYEFIGFDAGLMATMETAKLFEPYANYLIASEEIVPVGGFMYSEWVQYLADHPNSSGGELGTAICDSYYEKCAQAGVDMVATLSCLDLNEMQPVFEAFEQLSVELEETLSDAETYAYVARGITKTQCYGGNTPGEGYTNRIDAGHMAENIAGAAPDVAQAFLEALDHALVYQVKGSTRAYARGLSVFFPVKVSEEGPLAYDERYGEIVPSHAYKSFVGAAIKNARRAMEKEYIAMPEGAFIDDEGTFQMKIDPKTLVYVDRVAFSLYFNMDGDYVSLGSDMDVNMDWDTGLVWDNFRGMWPALDGNYVSMNIVEYTDEYVVYSIPILLNGQQTNLRAVWFWDDPDSPDDYAGHYEVLGAWMGIDAETGIPAREIVPVAEGDAIVPLFYYIDEEGEQSFLEGDEFTVEGGLLLEDNILSVGSYRYMFSATDVYGGETMSNYAGILINENGDMTIAA